MRGKITGELDTNVRLSISNRRRRRKYQKIAWNDDARQGVKRLQIKENPPSPFFKLLLFLYVCACETRHRGGKEMKFPRGAITHRDSLPD